MKKYAYLLICFLVTLTINSQVIEGKITLNEKSKVDLKLSTNSVNEFLEFIKSQKNQLKLSFKANGIEKKQAISFEFITVLKRNGETVKKMSSKKSSSFFPGDQAVPGDVFNNIVTSWDDMVTSWDDMIKKEGNYTVEIHARPKEIKGNIAPLSINFILRKRPGR